MRDIVVTRDVNSISRLIIINYQINISFILDKFNVKLKRRISINGFSLLKTLLASQSQQCVSTASLDIVTEKHNDVSLSFSEPP